MFHDDLEIRNRLVKESTLDNVPDLNLYPAPMQAAYDHLVVNNQLGKDYTLERLLW